MNSMYKHCSYFKITLTSFTFLISLLPHSSDHHEVAGASRPWRRRHVLRGYRLPPPHIADVARASSASTVVYSRSSGGDSCPLLQALVLWVSCGHTICSFHALHALSSPLWSSLCTLRHRRARPRLAPVTHCIAFLSLFLCLCFDAIWKFLFFELVRDSFISFWVFLVWVKFILPYFLFYIKWVKLESFSFSFTSLES